VSEEGKKRGGGVRQVFSSNKREMFIMKGVGPFQGLQEREKGGGGEI